MGWFRLKARVGGVVALFALLLQLALGFGHHHAPDFAGIPAHGQTVATSFVPAGGDADGDHAGDVCAICAVLHIAGTLVLPDTPAIAAPVAHRAAPARALFAQEHKPEFARAFAARGPPAA